MKAAIKGKDLEKTEKFLQMQFAKSFMCVGVKYPWVIKRLWKPEA
jgi:hypothetical protein